MTCRVVLCALLLLPLSAITSAGQVAKPDRPSKQQQARQHIQASQQYLQQQRQILPSRSCKRRSLWNQTTWTHAGTWVCYFFSVEDYAGAVPELRVAVKLKPDLWKLRDFWGLRRSVRDKSTR